MRIIEYAWLRLPTRMVSTTELGVCPVGDILVRGGDFMNSGLDLKEILSFDRWLREQPFKQRVVCAGSHNRFFENMPKIARSLLTDAIYLKNDDITIDCVSFWESPYMPEFPNSAFMYPRGEAAKRYWDRIPESLDMLITQVDSTGFASCWSAQFGMTPLAAG